MYFFCDSVTLWWRLILLRFLAADDRRCWQLAKAHNERTCWGRTPILDESLLQASHVRMNSPWIMFLIRRKRAKKFCYREILGRCTDLPGLPAIHCRPILAAWNVSSTYPPFEQELVELTLTPASRPLMLSVDAIFFRSSSIIRHPETPL